MPSKKTTSPKAKKLKTKAKAVKKVAKKTKAIARKPLSTTKNTTKTAVVKDNGCCYSEGRGFWTTLVVIVLLVIAGYFAYNNYIRETDNAQYFVEELDGVTTITPGPGMIPDGPPMIVPPTAPPTN